MSESYGMVRFLILKYKAECHGGNYKRYRAGNQL